MYCVPTSTRLTTPWLGARGSQPLTPSMAPRPLSLTLVTPAIGEEIYAGDRTQRGPRRDRMRPRGFGGGPAGFDPTFRGTGSRTRYY